MNDLKRSESSVSLNTDTKSLFKRFLPHPLACPPSSGKVSKVKKGVDNTNSSMLEENKKESMDSASPNKADFLDKRGHSEEKMGKRPQVTDKNASNFTRLNEKQRSLNEKMLRGVDKQVNDRRPLSDTKSFSRKAFKKFTCVIREDESEKSENHFKVQGL